MMPHAVALQAVRCVMKLHHAVTTQPILWSPFVHGQICKGTVRTCHNRHPNRHPNMHPDRPSHRKLPTISTTSAADSVQTVHLPASELGNTATGCRRRVLSSTGGTLSLQ